MYVKFPLGLSVSMIGIPPVRKGILKAKNRTRKKKLLMANRTKPEIGRDLDLDPNDLITIIKGIVAKVCSESHPIPISIVMLKHWRTGKQYVCYARQLGIYFSYKYCRLGTQEEVGARFHRSPNLVSRNELAVSSQIMGIDPRSKRHYKMFLECKKRIDEHPAFAFMKLSQPSQQPSKPAPTQ